MKTYKKIILILLLIMGLAIITSNVSMAIMDTESYNPGFVTQDDAGKAAAMTGTILATIRNIGIIAAVVVLTILGLKWMFGSVEEKANYKENIIPYIVGCFLLVSATTIPSIIYNSMEEEEHGYFEVERILYPKCMTCGETYVVYDTLEDAECPWCGSDSWVHSV